MAAALLLALPGCQKGEQASPPPLPVHKAKANPSVPPVQKQLSSATLSPDVSARLVFANRKDPFRPYLQAKVEKGPVAKSRPASLLPILSYAVGQFRVTGIIAGLRENKALVVDPAGKGYVVTVGTNIGSNSGVITKIGPSFIEISEKFKDDAGKTKKRLIKLSLTKKQ